MITPPTSSARWARKAVCRSWVNTPACRPYLESLTAAKASASPSDLRHGQDRPEDLLAGDRGVGRDVGEHGRRVGGAVALAAGEQRRRRRATASSTHDSTRLAASSLTSGPTSVGVVGRVAGDLGLDGGDDAAAAAGRTRTASAITRCTEMQDWPPW